MSLPDVGQHLVKHLVGLGTVGDVLKLDDVPEALAVLGDDVLAGGLAQQLRGQLLGQRQSFDIRQEICTTQNEIKIDFYC